MTLDLHKHAVITFTWKVLFNFQKVFFYKCSSIRKIKTHSKCVGYTLMLMPDIGKLIRWSLYLGVVLIFMWSELATWPTAISIRLLSFGYAGLRTCKREGVVWAWTDSVLSFSLETLDQIQLNMKKTSLCIKNPREIMLTYNGVNAMMTYCNAMIWFKTLSKF